MAKKKRILLVEDVESTRKSYKSRLEFEGYHVETASGLGDATDIINLRTFHVALVDIMLDGGKNHSNRDGVQIIKKINSLQEGTLIIPITGQEKRSFVRDTFKDYSVFDFIDKHEDVENKGWEFVIGRIEAAIARSELDDAPEWADLMQKVLHPDEEKLLVDNVLRLDKGIKFELLQKMLCTAVREFQPLVGEIGVTKAFEYDGVRNVVSGRFWSKAVGHAIEMELCRAQKQAEGESVEREVFYRAKGKLCVRVKESAMARNDFNA